MNLETTAMSNETKLDIAAMVMRVVDTLSEVEQNMILGYVRGYADASKGED